MLELLHITKDIQGKQVLADLSFGIGAGQKVALVGENGAGKTTLLRLLAGKLKPSSGSIQRSKGLQVLRIPQITPAKKVTVRSFLRKRVGINAAEKRLQECANHLEEENGDKRYNEALERFESLGGYEFDTQAKKVLRDLYVDKSLDAHMNEVSGGERSKVGIAVAMLSDYDILLLDEPTNNLDLASILVLERYLSNMKQACVVVSHDVAFLDGFAKTIIEIDAATHSATLSHGSYSQFLKRKEKSYQKELRAYEQQLDEVKQLRKQAQKQQEWAEKGAKMVAKDNDKLAQGYNRERAGKTAATSKLLRQRAEKLSQSKKPESRKQPEFWLNEATITPARLEVRDVVYSYPAGEKVGPINLTMDPGHKVALLGKNGEGKSTIAKLISGGLRPSGGEVVRYPEAAVLYLDQGVRWLPRAKTPLEFLMSDLGVGKTSAMRLMNKIGMGDQAQTIIKRLTPGQRMRLFLSVASFLSPGMLVLDEPTNHLDTEARVTLVTFLKDFSGTVLVISHDRDFLRKISCDEWYEVNEGRLTRIDGLETYEKKLIH